MQKTGFERVPRTFWVANVMELFERAAYTASTRCSRCT
jgi:hypothetical protein